MEMIDPRTENGVVRVALKGRMDADGLEDFEDRFLDTVAAPGKPAIVDFSQVEFMASMGMRLIILAAKTLASKGAAMVILRPQPLVAEVLKIAGLISLTPVASDENQALLLAAGQGTA